MNFTSTWKLEFLPIYTGGKVTYVQGALQKEPRIALFEECFEAATLGKSY